MLIHVGTKRSVKHDRDQNAAINISNDTLKQIEEEQQTKEK